MVLHEARERARKAGLMWFLAGSIAELGKAELIVGNLATAADHLRSSHALLETEEDRLMKPQNAASLACVLAQVGETGEAKTLALDARAVSSGDFALEALWRRALALVAASEGHFAEALRLSDEARTRADASDWLTFRGQTLEEAAVVRRLWANPEGKLMRFEGRSSCTRGKGTFQARSACQVPLPREVVRAGARPRPGPVSTNTFMGVGKPSDLILYACARVRAKRKWLSRSQAADQAPTR